MEGRGEGTARWTERDAGKPTFTLPAMSHRSLLSLSRWRGFVGVPHSQEGGDCRSGGRYQQALRACQGSPKVYLPCAPPSPPSPHGLFPDSSSHCKARNCSLLSSCSAGHAHSSDCFLDCTPDTKTRENALPQHGRATSHPFCAAAGCVRAGALLFCLNCPLTSALPRPSPRRCKYECTGHAFATFLYERDAVQCRYERRTAIYVCARLPSCFV